MARYKHTATGDLSTAVFKALIKGFKYCWKNWGPKTTLGVFGGSLLFFIILIASTSS